MNNFNQLEFPSCKKHSINNYIYISTNIQDQDDIFKCGQCVLEDINSNDYLYINTILKSQDDYIFNNWPPISNKKMINQLIQLVQDYKDPIQIIEDEFNSFKNEIVQQIDQQKKIILQKLQNLKIDKEEIHNMYNKISCKNKLKQILVQNESFEKINTDLQSFLKTSFEEKKQNNIKLQILIEKIKKYQQSPQIFQIQKIKNDFLKQLQYFEDQINQSVIFRKEINQIQQQLDLNMTDQSKIENNNFEQELHKQLSIFNSKYFYNVVQFNKCNQINLLYGKEEITNYQQSNEIKVSRDIFQNTINICRNKNIQYGYVYFKYPMSKSKKYICKIKFNKADEGQYILIGLINSNYLLDHLGLSRQGKSFILADQKYGGKIIKGEYFYKIGQNYIFDMMIDIQNSQIYFYDLNSQGHFSNINELQNDSLLDAESDYYLTFHFSKHSQNHFNNYEANINIVYFQELDNQ